MAVVQREAEASRARIVVRVGGRETRTGPNRMPRARNLKPSFFTNLELSKLKHGARLLFQGLWVIADREGRLPDSPEWVKAMVFPYERAPVDQWLNDLAGAGFIIRYEVSEARFIQIVTFAKHQSPHLKEPESTIPAPDSPDSKLVKARHASTNRNPQSTNRNPVSAIRLAFEPPTLEQVAAYCTERKNQIDPQAFVDFYTSKGWKVGNQGMKDWQAAVRTWERNSNGKSGHRAAASVGPGQRYRPPASG